MRTSVENYSPATTYDEALRRAARVWGIQDGYWDIWGKHHIASADLQRSILQSMGFVSETLQDLNEAILTRAELEWAILAPPTLVLPLSSGTVPVNIPIDLHAETLHAAFLWEDGVSERRDVRIDELQREAAADVGGRAFERFQIPLPGAAVIGYHMLILTAGGVTAETRLILCPDRAYEPTFLAGNGKGAGVAISLYGLRSQRNWGCGDFTDLKNFSDWAKDAAGVSFIALNPLHAIPNRQPYNTSPYLPNCTFYRNALYLDVESIEDVKASGMAQKLLASPKVQSEFAQLRASEYVEYEKVWAAKLRFLNLGFERFLERGGSEDFEHYVAAEGELLDRYALFCALEESIHEADPNIWIWPDWPEPYRNCGSEEVQEFRSGKEHRIQFYKWIQWHVDTQLAAAQTHARSKGMPIGLYHDLALATDRCGSDLWAYGDFYVGGCRVGAPPDGFSPKGQDWAFPPPNSLAHRLDGYRLFAESIRKNCRHGGALRIDHVMRFFRLYWIPEGKDAKDGAYVLDYAEDLVRILTLESVRNRVVVIGEDLGTVEPYIREILHQFGVLSYRLLYFEKNGSDYRPPAEYPRQALVSVSTHDLPTLAGFWENRDIEARRSAGVLPDEASYQSQLREREEEKQKMLDLFHRLALVPEWFPRRASDVREFTGELHSAAVGFLATTSSELMVLNQEDLFKDPEQQNLPGTTAQYPNWRHKMRYTIEELTTDRHAQDCTQMFHWWMERTGRFNRN